MRNEFGGGIARVKSRELVKLTPETDPRAGQLELALGISQPASEFGRLFRCRRPRQRELLIVAGLHRIGYRAVSGRARDQ